MKAETVAEIDWDALWKSGRPQRIWPSEDVVRFCARRLTPGMRVLEAGCGNGANLWFLQEHYAVTGIDCSREALRQARELCAGRGDPFSPPITLDRRELGRIYDPAQDAGQFDAVIDCRASQHMAWSQHGDVYADYRMLLKPGGWLFLLHLDDRTSDARQVAQRTASEAWTWDDIADGGVYAHNGLVCMPPALLLLGLVATAGFAVARAELLGRETFDDRFCGHLAVDAQAAPE